MRTASKKDPFAERRAGRARADVPEEFVEETAFDNLVAPASIEFSPDGRVFVGQLDGVIKVYDSARRHDAVGLRRPVGERRVARRPRPARAGARPGLHDRPPVPVRLVHLRRRDRRQPRRAGTTTAPIRRAPSATAASSAAACRRSCPTAPSSPLITDEWCQQYPSHSLGDLQVRDRRRALRHAPATARATRSPTTARTARRSTRAAIRPFPPAPRCRARTGGRRRAAQPGPAHERRSDRPQRLDPADRSRTPPSRCPTTRAPAIATPAGSSPTGSATPSASRSVPARPIVYVGDVGWLAWEEIDRDPDTTSQVRNYGWPCYEGAGRQGGLRGHRHEPLLRPLRGEQRRPAAVHVQPRGQGRQRELPGRVRVDLRHHVLRRHDVPARLPRRDVLRRLLAQLHLGHVPRTPTGRRTPRPARSSSTAPRPPSTSRSAPAATSTTPTSAAARSSASGRSTPTRRRPPRSRRRRPRATSRCRSTFDASGSSDPNEDPLLYAWDLDGDGDYDDSTADAPSRTYTQEGNLTVRLRVTDPSGVDRHRARSS